MYGFTWLPLDHWAGFVLQGLELRSRKRVWNNGDGRLKFVIFRDKECGTWSLFDSSVEGSKSDNELQQRTLLYSGRST